jgi:Arc/MetJ-type ribon-helix-helix transcriptional regulator
MAGYPPELDAYIEQKVRSGEFSSRDEFETEAVCFYRELEARHESLKSDIAQALAESKRGEVAPLDVESLKEDLRQAVDDEGAPK